MPVRTTEAAASSVDETIEARPSRTTQPQPAVHQGPTPTALDAFHADVAAANRAAAADSTVAATATREFRCFRGTKAPRFVNDSEQECAEILDFYGIPWEYEPITFVLETDETGRVTEAFSPDFYLPEQNLFLEVTTMRQELVTRKNRKVRKLRQRYPDVNVKLFYRRDIEALGQKLQGRRGSFADAPMAPGQWRRVSDADSPPAVATPSEPELGPIVYDSERIATRVRELGATIDADYAGRAPVLVTVLTGATMFAADLTRAMAVQHEMDFLAVSAYGSAEPGDSARVLKDLQVPVTNRDVILVEDVIDTGLTLSFILRWLEGHEPASLEVCTLLDRPQRRLVEQQIKYRGFTVPDRFLVGYGFDHRQKYRNLPDLHELLLTADDRERLLAGS